ncbi:MAG: pyruvate dehydrogenase E2 component (dihydrolipoamide acetyltransferase), partial [Cellvibrionaceae bacterium]
MAMQTISVPDIGGIEGAEVIEVSVAIGDVIEKDQAIVILETDKASMDIPSPVAGKVTAISVNEGDKVSEGEQLVEVDTEDTEETDEKSSDKKDANESSQPKTA